MVCLKVEDPQWELSQRSPSAFLSGSGIEFHYYTTERSLLPIPRPSPEVGDEEAESSNSLITWLVPLATSLHPSGLSKSHFININASVVVF